MRNLKSTLLFVFVALFVFAGPAFADRPRQELKNIPLEWRPTGKTGSGEVVDISPFGKATFSIAPFTDTRETPEEIGKNIEKRGTDRDLAVTTKENVAAWLTYRFGQVLKELGLTVTPGNGTCRIEADIRKFYVTESSTYKAEVGLKIRLLAKSGDVLWEGIVNGSASRFGSSYKADNYYETLSDAVMTAISGLLKNEEFRQAVKKSN